MATPALTPRRGAYLEPKDEDDSPRSSTHAPSPAMALKHFLAVLRKNWMLVGVVLSIAGARVAPAVGARDGCDGDADGKYGELACNAAAMME